MQRLDEQLRDRHATVSTGFSVWKRCFFFAVVIVVIGWALITTEVSLNNLSNAPHRFAQYIIRMFPPDLSVLREVMVATFATMRMSIAGSLLGALLALPFSFAASHGIGVPIGLAVATRCLLSVVRTIPSLVYAALFVTVVGLGELAGVMALAAFSFGIVSKLTYENLEVLDQGPFDAVRSAGGNTFHIFRYALLPQATPHFISATLYAWEINLRAAFVLGLVGAGGLGFELMTYIRLFEMQKVCTVLIVLVVFVALVDLLSLRLRRMVA